MTATFASYRRALGEISQILQRYGTRNASRVGDSISLALKRQGPVILFGDNYEGLIRSINTWEIASEESVVTVNEALRYLEKVTPYKKAFARFETSNSMRMLSEFMFTPMQLTRFNAVIENVAADYAPFSEVEQRLEPALTQFRARLEASGINGFNESILDLSVKPFGDSRVKNFGESTVMDLSLADKTVTMLLGEAEKLEEEAFELSIASSLLGSSQKL